MQEALQEDQVGVTLTFDGWTNVKNEQLLGIVIITSEGRPFIWKAIDISLERETHVEVMKKTEAMISELQNKEINVCAIVTDSADAYAAARYIFFILIIFNFNNNFLLINKIKFIIYKNLDDD